MIISRAELANAFCFKAPAPDFNLPSNQPDVKALLAAFLGNEDNKKNFSLDFYKQIGGTVTCYKSKTNDGEAYAVVLPSSSAAKAFKVDPRTGAAAEIQEGNTHLLVKLFAELANAKALQETANNLVNERFKSSGSGGPPTLSEQEVGNDLAFLDRNGTTELSSLIRSIWNAKDGKESAKLINEMQLEIISIVRSKEDALRQNTTIKTDYDIADLPLGS